MVQSEAVCIRRRQARFQSVLLQFIHGKECTNEACENRHSWAETKDILTFLERVPAQCPEAATEARAKAAAKESATRVDPATVAMNAKRQSHQNVIALQDRIIDDLLREINDLKRMNRSLKHDVAQLNQKSQCLGRRGTRGRGSVRERTNIGAKGNGQKNGGAMNMFSEQMAMAAMNSPMTPVLRPHSSCSPVTPEGSVHELGY